MSSFGFNTVGGLSDAGWVLHAKLKALNGAKGTNGFSTVVESASAGALTAEETASAIPVLAQTDLELIEMIGISSEETKAALTVVDATCKANKALAVVGLIGVGVFALWAWTKFNDQQREIDSLRKAIMDKE